MYVFVAPPQRLYDGFVQLMWQINFDTTAFLFTGHYIPELADTIIKGNKEVGPASVIQLKGIMVNSLVPPSLPLSRDFQCYKIFNCALQFFAHVMA